MRVACMHPHCYRSYLSATWRCVGPVQTRTWDGIMRHEATVLWVRALVRECILGSKASSQLFNIRKTFFPWISILFCLLSNPPGSLSSYLTSFSTYFPLQNEVHASGRQKWERLSISWRLREVTFPRLGTLIQTTIASNSQLGCYCRVSLRCYCFLWIWNLDWKSNNEWILLESCTEILYILRPQV